MVIVNFKDGSVKKFDLSDTEGLNFLGADSKQLSKITGIYLKSKDKIIALPMPKRFGRAFFSFEQRTKDGDNICSNIFNITADDVRLSVTLYNGQGPDFIRLDLMRYFKQVYNPKRR